MKKQISIILNPNAGTAANKEAIDEAFGRYPDVQHRLYNYEGSGDLETAAERALEEGADIIVAAGGDGTMNAVAGIAAHSGVPLGLLPMGTLNHLAKDLGVPLDINNAVSVICEGKTEKIDIGEVNGLYFVNNISLGFYPKAVRIRERLKNYITKWPALAVAVLTVLFSLPYFRIRLEWQGGAKKIKAPLVFIGNNAYELSSEHFGQRLALNRGSLWIAISKTRDVIENMKTVWAALRGSTAPSDKMETMELTEFTLRSRRHSFHIGMDGELVKVNNPLKVKIHPAALQVRTPAIQEKDKWRGIEIKFTKSCRRKVLCRIPRI